MPATWLIVLGAALDTLDGRIARFIGNDSKFGIEFDSLADIISFGVAANPWDGARVELRGLTSKKHKKLKLNGCAGVVVAIDSETGRIGVKLDDGRGPFQIPRRRRWRPLQMVRILAEPH